MKKIIMTILSTLIVIAISCSVTLNVMGARVVIEKVLIGDVNMDKEINIKDATMIQKGVASIIELTPKEIIAGDSDQDGNITIKDATCIQKRVAGMYIGLHTDLGFYAEYEVPPTEHIFASEPNPTILKYSEDDKKLTMAQLWNDKNMAKVCEAVNKYFVDYGMEYNKSLNTENTGWLVASAGIIYGDMTVNELKEEVIDFFRMDMKANHEFWYDTRDFDNPMLDWGDDYTREEWWVQYDEINCYYEQIASNNFAIYLCYKY